MKTTELPQIADKLYHIMSTFRHEWGSNSQRCWGYARTAHVIVNSTTMRSRPRGYLQFEDIKGKEEYVKRGTDDTIAK